MIRYRITSSELHDAISELNSSWFERADERTDFYAARHHYEKPPSSIWSDIKRVYMELQGYKCGFCERRLERSQFGDAEHDVEHFRPKAMVERWPPTARPERLIGLEDLDLGQTSTDLGYFLLPHHHENYLISCKTCNSSYKSNGFPVEGQRDLTMSSPRHTTERPYLCYPIGLFDEDPQDLIRFEGIVPVPAATRGRRRQRGKVIINFFGLAEREGLLLERSLTIVSLHLALTNAVPASDPLTQRVAQHLIGTLTSDQATHANWARSFASLWEDDRPAAEAYTEAALAHLLSVA